MNTKTVADFTRNHLALKISFSFFDGKMPSEKVAEVAAKAEHANSARIEGKILAIERKALRPISGPMAGMKTLWRKGDGRKLHGTRPWQDGGWRLIPADEYPEMRSRLDDFARAINDGIRDVFRTKYDSLKAEAEKELNGFMIGNFPPKEVLIRKYAVKIMVDRVAPMDNMAIDGLTTEQADEVRKERDTYYSEMITEGNRELIGDIVSAVSNLKERLSDKDSNFHGTEATGFPIFDNISRMVDRCEKFNITQDAKVTTLCKKVRGMLNDIVPQNVKEDQDARKVAVKTAKTVLDELAGF